jgi:hypothetical protein
VHAGHAARLARAPPLTTISALIVPCGVTTSQVPSGRWRVAITGVFV